MIVAALGALYVHLDDLKPVTAIFYGVSPALIALILHSCFATILDASVMLGRLAIGDWFTVTVGLLSLAALLRWKVSNPLLMAVTAELGNDSLGVIDLKSREVLRTLSGLNEPQGVGYEPNTDSVYVTNAGDGSVRIFQGENLIPLDRIDLGSDADNVRIDAAAQRVYVGHSDGAVAVIDAASRRTAGDIHLIDHPEGFQLDPAGPSIWINIPGNREIADVDRVSGRQIASWPMQHWGGNFPMALQADRGRLAVVFRQPARLAVFNTKTGELLDSAETCGDSDDVFVDTKRHRLYVSCGDGNIDVFSETPQGLSRSARVPTIRGARTALYSSELDQLFLAVRASGNSPASVWVFKATP